MPRLNEMTWLIGGEAGFGIQSAGHHFALICSRNGLWTFGNAEYPSLIRGGHNSNSIRVSAQEIGIHTDKIDVLLAMNKETLELHLREINPGGVVIYDDQAVKDFDFQAAGVGKEIMIMPVPLRKIAFDIGKGDITRNTVGVAASLALVGLNLDGYLEILRETFARKGEVVVGNNLAAAKAGYDFVKGNYGEILGKFTGKLEPLAGAAKKLLISGNDAFCLGALKAGVKFIAEYPMTPSSGILHFMAKQAKEYNLIVKHTEDELAAINMVVGASWAGARAMTATSGGGFSLMVEGIGMAGMIEAPAVIVEGQRGGPSTGLPTRTEQSDLQFAMHASQGEFPRIVYAPADMEELFRIGFEAFNWAEEFQLPVIMMTDKHLAESVKTYLPFDQNEMTIRRGKYINSAAAMADYQGDEWVTQDKGFYRYKFTEDGISPRVIPGVLGGRHRASTDEHDETGDLTETEENRIAMMDKRMKKMESVLKVMPKPEVVGPGIDGAFLAGPAWAEAECEALIVTWGSPKDALLEVMQKLKSSGRKVNLLVIRNFIPFDSEAIKEILTSQKKIIGVEMNFHGQMCNYLTEKTGVAINERLLKYSGRQFTAEELLPKILSILA